MAFMKNDYRVLCQTMQIGCNCNSTDVVSPIMHHPVHGIYYH